MVPCPVVHLCRRGVSRVRETSAPPHPPDFARGGSKNEEEGEVSEAQNRAPGMAQGICTSRQISVLGAEKYLAMPLDGGEDDTRCS